MKSFRTALSLAILAVLWFAQSRATAQTLPTPSTVTVTADPTTGALKAPANFITGNSLVTSSALETSLSAYLTTSAASSTYLTLATAATTYQPLDSDLTAIAALSTTSFGRGFLEIADGAALRTYASLAAASHTHTTSDVTNFATAAAAAAPVQSVAGKTGAVTLDKGDVGLGNVDNTADTAKPVSTAQEARVLAIGAHEVADALFSDGQTTNRRVDWTLGAAGAVAGQPVTLRFEFDMPASGAGTIASLCGSTGNPASQANACNVRLGSSGDLIVEQLGATPASDFRRLTWSGFRAAYTDEKAVRGAVVFEAGDSTTAPKIYVAGVDMSASFTLTTGGSAPNWMPSTLTPTKYLLHHGMPAGRFVPHGLIVGAFSSAEAIDWTKVRRLPTWCERGTGVGADMLINAADRDMSGANNWSSFNGGSVTVSGGKLVVTNASPNNGARLGAASMYRAPQAEGGALRLRVTISSATAPVRVQGRNNSLGAVVTFLNGVGDGTYDVVAQCSSFMGGSFALAIDVTSGSGASFEIDDISLIALGPVTKPIIQPLFVLADNSANALAGICVGVTPITQRRDWIIQAQTSTNGNQQLLGGDVFVDGAYIVLDDWLVFNKGSNARTVSLGSSSGGTQYLSGGTASVGRLYVTPALRPAAGSALWCASNGTDTLQHTVRGHIVD